MKNITSSKLGEWKENVPVQLTEEQRNILRSLPQESNMVQEVYKYISDNSKIEVSEEDSAMCEYIYNKHKPELKETDTFEFISCDMSVDGANIRGIINCRINNEHKQIRF